MTYSLHNELDGLLKDKLVTVRPHPRLPLRIYNYTVGAQFLAPQQWPEALKDCRGLVLDDNGEVVARPFRKFWNYEQIVDSIPADESFMVYEKVDGSLGIVASYRGERVVATRGSFESDQARWFAAWLENNHPDFFPGRTYLFEIVYPANRIVVDYGDTEDALLLAVHDECGRDLWGAFENCHRFHKARRFDGITDFSIINRDERFVGQEGLVLVWESGMRGKVKLEEYKRLHRLITQCSTRTIWELLRSGKGLDEIVDRVPEDFRQWVSGQAGKLRENFAAIESMARGDFSGAPQGCERKVFAEYAKKQKHPSLLFSLLDGRDISDGIWKLIAPKWETPFRKDADA